MHERKGMAAGCLDAETLAAYVDGGLTADERSRVEVHLAACQDCFAVFTESVKTVQAMEAAGEFVQPVAPTPAPVAPVSAPVVPIATARRSRLVRWTAAGAGLAAAAAVVLAVWWPRAERPELVDLVAAVGERRPVEGRLTGGFKFGPIESPTRGAEASTDWRVLAAAGQARRERARHRERTSARRARYGAPGDARLRQRGEVLRPGNRSRARRSVAAHRSRRGPAGARRRRWRQRRGRLRAGPRRCRTRGAEGPDPARSRVQQGNRVAADAPGGPGAGDVAVVPEPRRRLGVGG